MPQENNRFGIPLAGSGAIPEPAPYQRGRDFGAGIPSSVFRGEAKQYDIVNNYDWTTIPRGSALREEAPCAYVTAYELEFSQLQTFVDGYLSLASAGLNTSNTNVKDPGLEFYKNIYKATNQLGNFNFPFFSEDIRSFTTEYADTFSPISQRGAKFLGAGVAEGLGGAAESMIGGAIALGRSVANTGGNAIADKVAGLAKAGEGFVAKGFERLTGKKMPGLQTVGAPGSYIETPKFYQYSNTDNALEISFALANTITDDGEAKNSEFIKNFTAMNRPRRLGPIAMTYPAIYHIEVPGQRYIEWAYLENFQVGLLGTRRRIGRKIIPEAYSCNFSFRSLTLEAANFMDKIYDTEAFDEGDANYLELRLAADEDRAKNAARVAADLAYALGDRKPEYTPEIQNYPTFFNNVPGAFHTPGAHFAGAGLTGSEYMQARMEKYPTAAEVKASQAVGRGDLLPHLFPTPGNHQYFHPDQLVYTGKSEWNPQTGQLEPTLVPASNFMDAPNKPLIPDIPSPFDGQYSENNPGPVTVVGPDGATLNAEDSAAINNVIDTVTPETTSPLMNPDFDRSKPPSSTNPMFNLNLGTDENIPIDEFSTGRGRPVDR